LFFSKMSLCASNKLDKLFFMIFFGDSSSKKVESFRKTFCSTFLCLRIVLIFTMFSSFIFVQNDEA
jgi:hypothetical protein